MARGPDVTGSLAGPFGLNSKKDTEMLFRLTASTNVGCVRTNNEDNFIVNEDLCGSDWFVPKDNSPESRLGKNGAILVVADGMGGMNAGEVASAIAVDTVKEVFAPENFPDLKPSSSRNIGQFLKDAIVMADMKIKDRVKEDESTAGMGTTIVVAWILDNAVHVAWCGDSRAYLFNPASGLKRLTKDHSYVQELVDSGKLDPELAFDHPNSNIITRSLGDSYNKARPDYMVQTLSDGDVVLLCSDGLCGLCRDEEIAMAMAGADDIVSCRNELISMALDVGGYDNVTVALFEVKSMEECESDREIKDTNNDMGKLEKRKRNKRIIIWLSLACLLVLAVLWLYLSGHLSVVSDFLKEKYEAVMAILVNSQK